MMLFLDNYDMDNTNLEDRMKEVCGNMMPCLASLCHKTGNSGNDGI
jgi:hypothetical protein